jgi:hypothetical protein
MTGTPANAAVPSTTSWLGYWCTIARGCFGVSRRAAFGTSRNACPASLALGALRRANRGVESRFRSPRLRERGRVARAGACPAPRAKKNEGTLVLVLAQEFSGKRQQTVGLSQQTPVRSFFSGNKDIFPRLRFGKDGHTPGTPAFDSVSPSAGLFRELIPAISFFIFHRLRVGVRPESLALERRVHANVHRHADRHPGRAELARV